MDNHHQELERAKEILAALDEAIQTGPWNETVFLSAIGKKLQELRRDFKESIDLAEQAVQSKTQRTTKSAFYSQPHEMKEVFISLYNVDGNNIRKWEKLLTNLSSQVITRPVYLKEDDIKELMRSKMNVINEAYVAVYVEQGNILKLHPDKIIHDRLGHELIQLKDKAVKEENLHRFVHITGQYSFYDGKLVRQTD